MLSELELTAIKLRAVKSLETLKEEHWEAETIAKVLQEDVLLLLQEVTCLKNENVNIKSGLEAALKSGSIISSRNFLSERHI